MMENLSSYPEWSVMLNTLHQLLSYAVKDRLTFEISSREHPHQELVMHKYVLLGEGVTKYMEILDLDLDFLSILVLFKKHLEKIPDCQNLFCT